MRKVKAKKIPFRNCIVCGEKRPKKEMVRIVRTPDQKEELDYTGKKSGRGAYICIKKECIEKAKKTDKLKYALRIEIPPEIYIELENLLTTGGEAYGENKGV